MADTTPFAAALAKPDQPKTALLALAKLADAVLELKQFTIMACDQDRGTARRIFSDHPDTYPVGGEKPIPDNIWAETVLKHRSTFVGNSIEELAQVFPDWQLIQSLGLESCLNLPILIDDKVVGTLNCLNGPGHFTPERIVAANQLKIPGAAAFLLVAQKTGPQS